MLASMTVTPGAGVDFTALRNTLLVVAVIYIFSSLFSWAQAYVMAGVSQRTVYRMRRDVDEKLSRMPLQLLRQPPARRHPQPGDQRHRQHRQLAPADDDPAHHRGLHDHRRPRDDDLDQPAAGRHLAADRAAVDRRHDLHRQALAGPVRGPVGADRQAQRPRRGDAHRARHRQGVRPPAGGDRRVRGGERRALPGELSRPVPVGHDPADHGVHRQHQLRPDLRHRRHPGRQRPDEPRRRPGVRPVLAPVHDADHPDGQHRQRHPVGDRLGRARLRAARRGGGGAGRRLRRDPPRRQRAGRARARLVPLPARRRRSSRTSTSSSSRARRSPSSGRPGRARPRWSTC